MALAVAGLFLTVLIWGFSTINTRFDDLAASMNARFDDVNTRFDDVNARFDDVNARFDDVNARFDAVNARFDAVNARFDDVNARFDSIDRRLQNLETGFLDLSVRTARVEGHLGVPQAEAANEPAEPDSIARQ